MGSIYLKPVGGLCNRIRAIDSVLGVANECGKRLVVVWEKNPSLNCSFHDLFKPTSAFELIETNPFRGWSLPYFPDRSPTGFTRRALYGITKSRLALSNAFFYDELVDQLALLRPTTPERYQNLDEFDECSYDLFLPITEQLKAEGTCYLSTCWRMKGQPCYRETFRPTEAITAEVKRISQTFGGQTVGVHIRGTDAEAAKKYSSYSAFERQIEEQIKIDPMIRFFLASDEPELKRCLLDKYPSRMTTFDQPNYRRDSPKNIQNALVDLLCLAETQRVLGSYFSTFSQLAAHWSGVEESTVLNNVLINAA